MKHNGFVLAEGAGVIVLERRQSAQARGQKIYGKIERVISRNEAQKLLRSDTTGRHMLDVFQEAVGNTKPSYVNSQALGIETNDQIERFILKETFGDRRSDHFDKRDDWTYIWCNGCNANHFFPALNGIWIYPSYNQNNMDMDLKTYRLFMKQDIKR